MASRQWRFSFGFLSLFHMLQSTYPKIPILPMLLQLKTQSCGLSSVIWSDTSRTYFDSLQSRSHYHCMASLHISFHCKLRQIGSESLFHMFLSMSTKGPTPILHQLEKLLTKFLTNIKRSDYNYLCCFHKYFGRCRHPLKRASLGLTPPRWMMRLHSTVMYRSSTTHNWRWWCTWRHRVWHLICEHKYEFAHLF